MKTRFLIPTLLFLGLLSGAVVWWIPSYFQEQLKEEVIRRGRLGAELLDKSALGALVVDDRPALNQLALGLLRSNEILYVLFLDKDGQVVADSGIEEPDYADIRRHFPRVLKGESDWTGELDHWPSSLEPCVHLARPVFYEQLRVGTVMVGLSLRRADLTASLLRKQLGLLCGILFVTAAAWAMRVSLSVTRPLRLIAQRIDNGSNESLQKAASGIPELKAIAAAIEHSRGLYSAALKELEDQSIQREADLTKVQEESALLGSKLNSALKQVSSLQDRLRASEAHARDLQKQAPLVQFATQIVTDVESSMKNIGLGADQLRQDLERLNQLIELYEKAASQSPEDLKNLKRYKESISYQKIHESLDELVATIRGGASWAEQLVDLLKQLASASSSRPK